MHQNQLPIEMKKRLKSYLLLIKKGEMAIEEQRQRLSADYLFEPYPAFQRIDRDYDTVISPMEMLRFLR